MGKRRKQYVQAVLINADKGEGADGHVSKGRAKVSVRGGVVNLGRPGGSRLGGGETKVTHRRLGIRDAVFKKKKKKKKKVRR